MLNSLNCITNHQFIVGDEACSAYNAALEMEITNTNGYSHIFIDIRVAQKNLYHFIFALKKIIIVRDFNSCIGLVISLSDATVILLTLDK